MKNRSLVLLEYVEKGGVLKSFGQQNSRAVLVKQLPAPAFSFHLGSTERRRATRGFYLPHSPVQLLSLACCFCCPVCLCMHAIWFLSLNAACILGFFISLFFWLLFCFVLYHSDFAWIDCLSFIMKLREMRFLFSMNRF